MTGRYVENRKGRIVKTKRMEGEIGARCLFVKLPLSLRRVSSEKGFGNGGELLRRLGTVERNGQQYCRRGSGDLRGADRGRAGKGLRVTWEINYTLLKILTSV